MKECESCGVTYDSHDQEDLNLCCDCIEDNQVPPTKSIIDFWKNRVNPELEDESA